MVILTHAKLQKQLCVIPSVYPLCSRSNSFSMHTPYRYFTTRQEWIREDCNTHTYVKILKSREMMWKIFGNSNFVLLIGRRSAARTIRGLRLINCDAIQKRWQKMQTVNTGCIQKQPSKDTRKNSQTLQYCQWEHNWYRIFTTDTGTGIRWYYKFDTLIDIFFPFKHTNHKQICLTFPMSNYLSSY